MDVKRIGTVVDTANRRRNKKIPKSRAEDFQALVSINADAMVVLDHEGYVLYVNPAAESLFRLSSAEMVGAFFGFPIILDEPVELHVLREFKDFVGVEMRMVEVKWAGEASYLLSFRDLTDRIKAEQAMSRARGELDGMVTQRTIELSEINRQLKREITERKRAEEERTRLIHDLGERLKELKALHSTYVIFQKADAIPEILQEITTSLPLAWQYPEITAARISFNGQKYLTPNFLETPWVQRADFHISGGRNGSIEVCYTKERPGEAEGPFLAEERALIDSLAEMLRTYLDKRFTEEALVEAKAQAELYLDLMGHDINNMHQIALGYLELARICFRIPDSVSF
jgi:PAS domain-containing protein